jgi:hypothetical protein
MGKKAPSAPTCYDERVRVTEISTEVQIRIGSLSR